MGKILSFEDFFHSENKKKEHFVITTAGQAPARAFSEVEIKTEPPSPFKELKLYKVPKGAPIDRGRGEALPATMLFALYETVLRLLIILTVPLNEPTYLPQLHPENS